MLFVTIPLPYFIIATIIILIIIFLILIMIKINKKNKVFITKVIYKLMKEKMENINYYKTNLYDLSFSYNNKNFYTKIYHGGKNKGFIMTNPTMIYEQKYSSSYGPSKKSKQAIKLTPFLIEKFDGIKVILIQNNMFRMTKYINENEIEEVRFNEPAFSTYLVQEKDFYNFIDLIKKKKK